MIPASYLPVVANRDFRLLSIGLFFSRLCDHFTWLGLTWLVLELTGSAAAVGGIVLVTQLPAALTGPLAGALLDRFHRYRPMLADNLVRGLITLAIPALAVVGELQLWHVYVLAGLYSCLMPITEAGGRALLPDLVDRQDLPAANAVDQMLWQISFIVGSSLIGLLIAQFGAVNAFAFETVAFFVVAIIIARLASVASPQRHIVRVAEPPSLPVSSAIHAETIDGARYVARHPGVRSLTALSFGLNLTYGPLEVVLPIYADRVLQIGPTGLGLLWSAFAAGSLIGVIAVGSRTWRWRRSVILAACVVSWGIIVLPLAWIAHLTTALLLLFIAGVIFAPYTVLALLSIQETVPMHYRGRVFGISGSSMRAGIPLGAAVGGLLLPVLGLPGTIVASGVSSMVAGIVGLSSSGLRQLDGSQSIAPAD